MAQPACRLDKAMVKNQVINLMEGEYPKKIGILLNVTIKLIYETDNMTCHQPEKLYWKRKDWDDRKFNLEWKYNHLGYIYDEQQWDPETGAIDNLYILPGRLYEHKLELYNQTSDLQYYVYNHTNLLVPVYAGLGVNPKHEYG